MLSLDGTGADKKPVGDVGFERLWPRASHGGFHAAKRDTIWECLDGDGI